MVGNDSENVTAEEANSKNDKNFSCFLQGYTKCMDMWGVGCCLAEMVCNRPTFPGKNYLDQIHKITDILGTPTKSDSEFIVNPKVRQ